MARSPRRRFLRLGRSRVFHLSLLIRLGLAGFVSLILGSLSTHLGFGDAVVESVTAVVVVEAQMTRCVAPPTFPVRGRRAGLPTFVERYSIKGPPPPYEGTSEAVVLDADEDGDPDIILTNETASARGGWEHGYRNVVLGWRNRGDGTFRRATRQFFPQRPVSYYVREALLLDANGDGGWTCSEPHMGLTAAQAPGTTLRTTLACRLT